jgi:hypothetical protein
LRPKKVWKNEKDCHIRNTSNFTVLRDCVRGRRGRDCSGQRRKIRSENGPGLGIVRKLCRTRNGEQRFDHSWNKRGSNDRGGYGGLYNISFNDRNRRNDKYNGRDHQGNDRNDRGYQNHDRRDKTADGAAGAGL